jgi:hypothetical protein
MCVMFVYMWGEGGCVSDRDASVCVYKFMAREGM